MEILIPVILLVASIGAYVWYATIVSRRNKALQALGTVDAHLQQRADLIPNLLRAARRFMTHEKDLIEEVTRLRAAATAPYDEKDAQAVGAHLDAARALGAEIGRLRIAVEAYPELRSERSVNEAMEQMGEVEAQIAAARRYYNAAVARLNDSVQVFPGDKIAGLAKVEAMPFYEASEAARAPVNADDYLT